MPKRLCALLRARGIPFEENVSMADRTTLRVGGPADVLVEATGAEAIAEAFAVARETDTPVLVIGNGSNLLVKDTGLRGLTVVIGSGMEAVRQEGNTLHAQAGALLGRVAQIAQRAGLSGLEGLSGIPGTVGGAVCMNAGAYGAEMAQRVVSVKTISRFGETEELSNASLAFGYRHSAVMDRQLSVTDVTFRLTPAPPEEIAAMMREYAGKRREKQPLTLPSAGSFFKRPVGHFAGALIEQASLKGVSVGGAQVSEKHGGFLVNTGGATAQDFLDLMELIQARVYENSGVRLEPEVQILG